MGGYFKTIRLQDGSVRVPEHRLNGIKTSILFTDDNEIYLDGKKVDITFSSEENTQGNEEVTGSNMTSYYTWCSPYGSASSYSYFQKKSVCADLSTHKIWSNIGKAALAVLVTSMFCAIPGVDGLSASISFGLATSLMTEAKEEDPYSSHLSVKTWIYYRKEHSSYIGNSKWAYKIKAKMYGYCNFATSDSKGKHKMAPVNDTFYRVNILESTN